MPDNHYCQAQVQVQGLFQISKRPGPGACSYCQARVHVSPGQVQVGSRWGPGWVQVNIKVYFKSLRDLDLELVAIIAIPPPPPPPQPTHPPNFSKHNIIEISSRMN